MDKPQGSGSIAEPPLPVARPPLIESRMRASRARWAHAHAEAKMDVIRMPLFGSLLQDRRTPFNWHPEI